MLTPNFYLRNRRMKGQRYGDNLLVYLDKGQDLDLRNFQPGYYGVDTERMGLDTRRDRVCVIQIYDMYNRVAYVMSIPKQVYPNQYIELRRFFKDRSFCKIFHYAMGDVSSLRYTLNSEVNNVLCTKVMSKVGRTFTSSHGLASLTNLYLKCRLDKSSQTTYWGGSLTEKQVNYSVHDVLYLHHLVVILLRYIVMEDREKPWQRLNKSVELLAHNLGEGWDYQEFLDWA